MRTARLGTAGAAGRVWTPALLGDAALWLEADAVGTPPSDGGALAQWNNLTGNAPHAAQATGGLRPTFHLAAQNGLPAVRFASQNLLGAYSYTGTDLSVFVLGKMQTGAASQGTALSFANTGVASNGTGGLIACRRSTTIESVQVAAGGSVAGTVAITYNTTFCWDIVTTSANIKYAANAATQATGTLAVSHDFDIFCLGANLLSTGLGGTAVWSNDLYAVLVVPRAVTTIERQRIQGYLMQKWGLASLIPSTHPYKTVAPVA
jgi:hypothetical protein